VIIQQFSATNLIAVGVLVLSVGIPFLIGKNLMSKTVKLNYIPETYSEKTVADDPEVR